MGMDTPPDGIAMCQGDVGRIARKEEISMEQATIIGLALAE